MTIRIVTNNVPRDLVDASALTTSEREGFDYLDWQALEDGSDSASFFRYKGQLYDLGDFETTSTLGVPNAFGKWDGFASDSFFSGIVVRLVEDGERVVVGLYLASD